MVYFVLESIQCNYNNEELLGHGILAALEPGRLPLSLNSTMLDLQMTVYKSVPRNEDNFRHFSSDPTTFGVDIGGKIDIEILRHWQTQ